MPEMNDMSMPVATALFCTGSTIVRKRWNHRAPAMRAASSGSGPSCIIAEIPAREANGICSVK